MFGKLIGCPSDKGSVMDGGCVASCAMLASWIQASVMESELEELRHHLADSQQASGISPCDEWLGSDIGAVQGWWWSDERSHLEIKT